MGPTWIMIWFRCATSLCEYCTKGSLCSISPDLYLEPKWLGCHTDIHQYTFFKSFFRLGNSYWYSFGKVISARDSINYRQRKMITTNIFSIGSWATTYQKDNCCWAQAHIKIARMTLTIKLDRNWNSFQLANSAPPLSVTDSALAPSARMFFSGFPG